MTGKRWWYSDEARALMKPRTPILDYQAKSTPRCEPQRGLTLVITLPWAFATINFLICVPFLFVELRNSIHGVHDTAALIDQPLFLLTLLDLPSSLFVWLGDSLLGLACGP